MMRTDLRRGSIDDWRARKRVRWVGVTEKILSRAGLHRQIALQFVQQQSDLTMLVVVRRQCPIVDRLDRPEFVSHPDPARVACRAQ